MSNVDRRRDPLLGEWACLGILCERPAHGWAIVTRLRPDGDIGRIWQLSRPLTYRAIDQLTARGWIEPVGEEPGRAGPNRTILAPTRTGRARWRAWLRTPVPNVRDLRSELLLKLVFAERYGIDLSDMLDRQRAIVDQQADALARQVNASDRRVGRPGAVPDVAGSVERDVVALWRLEATEAARRFLDRIHPTP